jgi:hypothetical protein|tara:strand:+ start:103 stop:315 length:213 start_codon:yes stop_codon:yes gene_type:complete
MTPREKLTNRVAMLPTEQLKDAAAGTLFMTSVESDIVSAEVLRELETRITKEDFVKFCDYLDRQLEKPSH